MTTTRDTATTKRRGLSRRAFLKTTAGTAALLGAVQTKFPAGVHIAEAAGPEVTKAILGFIALTDARRWSSPRRKASSPSTACPASR